MNLNTAEENRWSRWQGSGNHLVLLLKKHLKATWVQSVILGWCDFALSTCPVAPQPEAAHLWQMSSN